MEKLEVQAIVTYYDRPEPGDIMVKYGGRYMYIIMSHCAGGGFYAFVLNHPSVSARHRVLKFSYNLDWVGLDWSIFR